MIAPRSNDESSFPVLKRLKYVAPEPPEGQANDGSEVASKAVVWILICLGVAAVALTAIYVGPELPILFSVLLLVISAIIRSFSGLNLPQKFASLGALAGRSKGEILAVVGPPTSISAADGKVLLHWESPRYQIVLMFSGELCESVAHEWRAVR